MGRPFSLAGLLRLRRIQEDQIASDLAAANARVRENSVRARRARAALGGTSSTVSDTATLYALAATRASSRSMLAELDAVGNGYRRDAEVAQQGFTEARKRSVGLEKLADKHADAVASDELHAEQNALDELAAAAWQRKRKGESDAHR